MEIMITVKHEPVRYVVLDGEEFRLDEVFEFLEQIDGRDVFDVTQIFNEDLANVLLDSGVVNQVLRGGFYPGDEFLRFTEELGRMSEEHRREQPVKETA